MDQNSERIIAATLTAAIIGKIQFPDVNEAMREAVRVYRSLSRRLHRIHDDEERAELVATGELHEDPVTSSPG
jgi:hypothetical protein